MKSIWNKEKALSVYIVMSIINNRIIFIRLRAMNIFVLFLYFFILSPSSPDETECSSEQPECYQIPNPIQEENW